VVNVILPSPAQQGRPIGIPSRLTDTLAGRETLLTEIHERFLGEKERPWPRIVALHGVGGAGKTAVAVEYAHRHLADVEAAWLLSAENPTGLEEAFRALAAQLGVTRTWFDPRDPVRSVHGVLADYQLPWLLIFDGARDAGAVRNYLPPAGPGLILITSLDGTWPDDEALLVPPLDQQVAAVFLTNRTRDPDAVSARAIADDLGGLPLALAQAAAYIATRKLSLSLYQSLFVKQRDELLNRGEAPGHPVTVAATLGLALSQLESGSPEAATLLRLLAFIAPEPVPLGQLLGPLNRETRNLAIGLDSHIYEALIPLLESDFALVEAAFELHRYSLLTNVDGTTEVMHRLVQVTIQGQMRDEEAVAWRQAAASLVEAAIPDDPEFPADWPVFAVLLPHARVTLDGACDGMARLAEYLGRSGSYPAARDLWEQIYRARDAKYGATDVRALRARAALAVWIGEAGDPVGARDRIKSLLLERSQLSDPADNEDYLSDRYQLASFTGRAGDAALAREMLAELLPIQERALGIDHRYVLATRHQLAAYTGHAGDPAQARDMLAELLPIRERVLGCDHPHTLSTRHQHASFTGEIREYASARDMFAELLPIRELILGPEHPDTLATRSNLTAYTAYAGGSEEATQAKEFFESLLGIRERILGPGHPDTLAARHQFATFIGRTGDFDTARDLFAELVSSREQVSGAEHPHTLSARHQLAVFTGRAGNPAAARDLLANLLPIRERILGLEHPATEVTRKNLLIWARSANLERP
jgi:hypothetical protein